MRRFDFNFEFLAINLSHAFDFSESDGIAIVEPVLLFLVKTDQSSLFLSDSGDVNSLALFSGSIDDLVVFSKIDESESIETEVASVDESMSFFADSLVELDEVVSIIVIKYDHTFVISGSASFQSYMLSIESLTAMFIWTLEFRFLS